MLFYLSQYLLERAAAAPGTESLSFLRVFRYITVRSAGAAVTALLISWWFGPRVIAWLKALKFGQDYKDKAEEAGGIAARVLTKRGTPTMGGVLIVLAMDLSALLWAQLNELVVLTLLSLVLLAGLGFYDDYAKITQQSNRGAQGQVKVWVQTLLALFIGVYLWRLPSRSMLITDVMVPFCKHPVLTGAAGVGLLLTVLTIVGSSNAVNLTDGLDGLAIGCTLIVSTVFLVMTYIAGHHRFAEYLQVPYVPGAGELTVFCAAMFGAGLGLSVVQLSSRTGFHGRHWLARARRRVGNHGGADPSAARAGDCGRSVCRGSRLGHLPNALVQVYAAAVRDRAADLPDGAFASSFRKERLVRVAGRDALLHSLRVMCGRRPQHSEIALNLSTVQLIHV